MKLTSNEAKKLLDGLNEELQSLRNVVEKSDTFVVSTVENVEDVRPVFDYNDTNLKINKTIEKIAKVKYAISKFNLETILPYGGSIAEALVLLPNYNAQLNYAKRQKERLPKTRASWGSNNGFINYEYANYKIEDAITNYGEIETFIKTIQTQLDVANNTIREIEINF